MPKIKFKGKKGGGSNPLTPLQVGAGAVFPYSVNLARKHAYFDRYGEPYNTSKTIGKNTDNVKLLLPRALFPVPENDNRVVGDDIDFEFIGEPRNDEQLRVLEELQECYELGTTGVTVNASTGFGKTFIGCYHIAMVGRPTLVLITKSDLQKQWTRSFSDFLGIPKSEVGLIKGDVYDVIGKKVVIGFVQSVMKDGRYPSWVYKQFGNVISDEVHLMGAQKFNNCMYLLPAKYRLGLSATLKRGDGKSHVFLDHIGKTIIKAELLPMDFDVVKVETGIRIPKHVKYKAGRTMGLNTHLGGVKSRQTLITNKIKSCLKKGRNIVCFADTREHLENAYNNLIDNGVKHSQIGFYVGGMSDDEMEYGAHKPVVLTTYKMCEYGTDFPHWDTAMLMTPRANVEQIVGRIVRELEGKTNPVVFDFVDDAKLLKGYWGARMKFYIRKANRIIN